MFQDECFNCIGHGIVHQRLERPHFQPLQNILGILVPPHMSLQREVPTNDGWQEIVNPSVSDHRDWSTMSLHFPPLVNPNVQIAHVVSQVQYSHASKRLKTDIPQHVQDKGK